MGHMGTYGCIGLGEHEKQTHKDTHGLNAHDYQPLCPGNFLKYMHLTVIWAAGNRWSRMVVGY